MKRRRLQSAGGFTLIEVMISLAIATLVILYIAQTFGDTSKLYVHNKEKVQTETRAQLASAYISQEIRNAGYIVGWDATPDSPPIAVNQPITGATVDPQTESLTVRYAQGPLTGAGAPVALLNGVFPAGSLTLTVQPLTFAIGNGTLVAIYSPATTVNVRRVAAASNVGSTTITLVNPTSINFPAGAVVAIVQESSFWIQGGNLLMRTAGVNQQIAGNVEDLQIVLINNDQSLIGNVSSAAFAGMTTAQLLNVRAVRLSLTSRTSRALVDVPPAIPPTLEDHDRSGQPGDRVLRVVEQTTVYLRNFGVLGP
jgi:prepilin-type N-terminal cleavage/methylation domain-containing protein